MKETLKYTKNDAAVISGVAIILMFIHHIWGLRDSIIPPSELYSIINIKGVDSLYMWGMFGKLCVALFAFNTGYSMYIRPDLYDTWTKRLKRIIKFLLCYWIVYFLFIIYALLSNDMLPTLKYGLLNLFGLMCVGKSWVCVPFAWYVSFYVIIILCFPIIDKCFRKHKLIVDVVLLAMIQGALVLIRSRVVTYPVLLEIAYDNLYFFCVMVGYLTCKYDLFCKVKDVNILWNIVFFICLFIVRWYLLRSPFEYWLYDAFCGFIFIRNILPILRRSNVVIKSLQFLGKYSIYLWFLHGIFITGQKSIQWLLYYPKYSILIIIWAFVMLVPIAMFLHVLQKRICSFLKLN